MWWSPDDGDGACLMMMQLGDALMMPYVFTVFIDACGWIQENTSWVQYKELELLFQLELNDL